MKALDLALLGGVRWLADDAVEGAGRLILQLLLPRVNLIGVNLIALRQLVDARLLAHRLQGNLRLQRRVNLPSCSLRHGLLCSVKQRSSRSSNQAPGPKNGVRFRSSHRRGLRSCLEDLADARFAAAKVIVLIKDNLSIHSKASLYEAFRPGKPGGWSSGSNGVTRQNTAAGSIWRSRNSAASCRPSVSTAASPISKSSWRRSPPWEQDRNKNHTKADWRFTTATARIKLRHLYPSF